MRNCASTEGVGWVCVSSRVRRVGVSTLDGGGVAGMRGVCRTKFTDRIFFFRTKFVSYVYGVSGLGV
jgi:hypothetical protein